MILSRLTLDERHRAIYHDLDNLHALHQRVMQGFPDEAGPDARAAWNVLYRREPGQLTLLVQSDVAPDWKRLPQGYLEDAAVKDLAPILNELRVGQFLRFRLLANPTRRDNQSRKLVALRKPDEQEAWMSRQAMRAGFRVVALRIGPSGGQVGRKRGDTKQISLHTVLFDGTLEVTDAEALRGAVRQGIGRGRSYGCGLLSLAPVAMD